MAEKKIPAGPQSFIARVCKFGPDVGMHYLEVPARVFRALGGKPRIRLVAEITTAKLKFHCALMPVGDGKVCIYFSKEKMKLTGTSEGSTLAVTVKLDRSKYGMKVPPEFQEILKQNPEAHARFDRLTAGKQRNILFDISSAKNSERRLNRAFQLMEALLLMPEGKESMQLLLGAGRSAVKGAPPAASEASADEEFRRKFLPISAAPGFQSSDDEDGG